MTKSPSNLRLFIGTFAAAFMFIFGIGTLGMMLFPAFALVATKDGTKPSLPLAGEPNSQATPTKAPNVQPYPALADIGELVEKGDFIRIPAIGVNVPLVMSDTMEDNDVLSTLAFGAALYPNGVEPGHLGNSFIAAHSTGEPWKGKYRFAFLKINELESGNLIHLDYNGTRYTYKIVEKQIIDSSPSVTIASDRPVPTVTLMACWPLWTTNQRMLVKGELTNITKLTPRPA